MRATESLKRVKTSNEDQKHGIEIVKKAITWPARQIAINSGEDGSVVVGKILENDTYAYGFDAQTGEFGNLVTKGIIDPTKVVRIALQDGASTGPFCIRSTRQRGDLLETLKFHKRQPLPPSRRASRVRPIRVRASASFGPAGGLMLLQQERAGVEVAVDRERLREALAPTVGRTS